MWLWILISELDSQYLPSMVVNFALRDRYSVCTEYCVEFRYQRSIFGIYRICCWISILGFKLDIRYTVDCGAAFLSQSSIFDIYQIWCCISISDLDIRSLSNMVLISLSELNIPYIPNVVLNFDFRARYSVSIEHGVQFLSQSSIFGRQPNVEPNFDPRARYLVSTE